MTYLYTIKLMVVSNKPLKLSNYYCFFFTLHNVNDIIFVRLNYSIKIYYTLYVKEDLGNHLTCVS